MPTYSIPSFNMPKLETRLAQIKKKCDRYGCDFNYRTLGEHVEEVKTEQGTAHIKFIDIEVEGTAIAETGWRLVAVRNAMEGGVVIRQFDDSVDIPTSFQTAPMTCEHCHSNRHRTQTCLLYHPERNEWKQVGTSCLKDYTGNLSAEHAAGLASFIDTCERAQEYDGLELPREARYFPVRDVLIFARECVKHWGYHKTQDPDATAYRALDFYRGAKEPYVRLSDVDKELMESVNFNADAPGNAEFVDAALEWILTTDTSHDNYLNNLKVIAKSKYFTAREAGIILSLIPTYANHLKQVEREKMWADENARKAQSKYCGEIGERISVDIQSTRCVTYWENMYGTTWLYEFITTDGNVIMWATSAFVDDDRRDVTHLVGTVSKYEDYNGVAQTWVKRAKLEYGPKKAVAKPEPGKFDNSAIDLLYQE